MAVTFDATANGSSSGSNTTLSFSITIGSGANRAIGIGVGWSIQGVSAVTVTVGGVSATLVTGTDTVGNQVYRSAIYALANPASGAQTVVVSWTGACVGVAGAVSVTGADQATPINNGTFTAGPSAGNNAVSITSNAGDLTFASIACESGSAPITPTQTSEWTFQNAFTIGSGGSIGPGTAGPISHAWTTGSGFEHSGANFKAASTASSSPRPIIGGGYY